VALLPDLSGTVIESNAVVFDGAGMFVRAKGAKNSNDLAGSFTWGGVLTCNTAGGGLGADCNGYPDNAFRYDTPTWAGFSMSTSYGEDDMWDIAIKYAADWNSVKFSAAAGYTQLTDEGCSAFGVRGAGRTCSNVAVVGGGGTPFQNYRQDGQLFQVGASIMHVPSGLFVYGLYQNDQNDGTQIQSLNFNTGKLVDSAANESDTWFVKAGIKRAWMPAGATVLFGEWGQYNDMFRGLCAAGVPGNQNNGTSLCTANIPIGVNGSDGTAILNAAVVNGSEVQRFGLGIVQEIDSAAMHVFARWQHMDLDLSATDNAPCSVGSLTALGCGTITTTKFKKEVFTPGQANKNFGKGLSTSFDDLEIFQIGGVIFF
jgi:hypothetical protein